MPETTPSFTVDLQPTGRRIQVPAGTTLLEAAQKAGIDLVASCGRAGFCGTCLVKVIHGGASPLSLIEQDVLDEAQIRLNLRLACQTQVLADVRVFIPPESLAGAQQLQVEGIESETQLNPDVFALDLEIAPPSLHDLRADLRRVDDALKEHGLPPLKVTPSSAALLSNYLRQHDWKTRLVLRTRSDSSEWVACLAPGEMILGLAMDIGSTKLAMYLVDLETGGTLATSGLMNPQIAYGEDVVSRIAFSNRSPENQHLLQTLLVDAINKGAADLCAQQGLKTEQIVDLVVVGNTAIHHFFCGLPVEQLGHAPYVPVVQDALQFSAAEMGLNVAPFASVYLPPNIAGYVGADHVSALTVTHAYAIGVSTILVDIGTNTEISLIHEGKIYSCSCASGPAFEGAHIHDGMRAVPGAVEKVTIADGQIHVHTIGGLPALGMCGSGILSAIAEMLSNNLIDRRGAIHHSSRSGFQLVPQEESGNQRPITINRKDIHEIQLAKGAIRAGIEVLLNHAALDAAQIQQWVLAGAFGTHIDLGSAVRIGMFPNQPLERFHQVGNAAGVGARQMLVSTRQRQLASSFIDRVQYIELTTEPDFQDIYVESLFFPE
jgi:uncharacterized 2Fe-2S/4Fe-4S cluster protein (DUF4445 family)